MNKEIKITPNGIKQALENLLNENEQLQQENQQQNQLLKDKGFIIDKVRNNLEKDISVIKDIKMSNKEIICRLEETNKLLKEVK